MTALVYSLSMPGCPSWNGRWSGEGRCYAIVETIPAGKKYAEKAEQIVANGPYSYRWSDGWCASIRVHIAERTEINRIRRASHGFCGYDWMVQSIKEHGDIRAEAPAAKATQP